MMQRRGNRRNEPVMHQLPRPYDNWFDYYLFNMRVQNLEKNEDG